MNFTRAHKEDSLKEWRVGWMLGDRMMIGERRPYIDVTFN